MNRIFIMICFCFTAIVLQSCITSGAGGAATGAYSDTRVRSWNDYELEPIGNRVTYTIDISTPEGKLKLQNLSLSEAKRLAETEAARVYNCDRLIDPRFDYLMKGKRILRITIDGRPGVYKSRYRY